MKKTDLTPEQFKKRWIAEFAGEVRRGDLSKLVLSDSNHIWHVFSFNLIPKGSWLEGDAARKAFDRADKKEAEYVIYYGNKETVDLPYVTAEKLDRDEDIVEMYVVGADRDWTYILTHEDGLGPYFYSLNK